MVYRLTQDEKDRLLREERRRRILVRKQQVRVQADEYSRSMRESVKERTASIVQTVRNEVASGVHLRVERNLDSSESTRRSPRFVLRQSNSSVMPGTKTPQRTKHNDVKGNSSAKRRSIRSTERSALEKAKKRGQAAVKLVKKTRRSEESKKKALMARRAACKEYFNNVSKLVRFLLTQILKN